MFVKHRIASCGEMTSARAQAADPRLNDDDDDDWFI